MEIYLLYEFTNHNWDEDIEENIDIIGAYYNIDTAIEKANERVAYGLKECNVIIDPKIKNKNNPFEETSCLQMYREGIEDDEDYLDTIPIYDIVIGKLQVE